GDRDAVVAAAFRAARTGGGPRRLGEGPGGPPAKHPSTDGRRRVRPGRRGGLLAPRQDDPLPGGGGGAGETALAHLLQGARDEEVPPAVPRRGQDDVLVLRAGRQEDHLREHAPRPRREVALRAGAEDPRRGAQDEETPPLRLGLRPDLRYFRG